MMIRGMAKMSTGAQISLPHTLPRAPSSLSVRPPLILTVARRSMGWWKGEFPTPPAPSKNFVVGVPRHVPEKEVELLEEVRVSSPHLYTLISSPVSAAEQIRNQHVESVLNEPEAVQAWIKFLADMNDAGLYDSVIYHYDIHGPSLGVEEARFVYLSALGHRPNSLHSMIHGPNEHFKNAFTSTGGLGSPESPMNVQVKTPNTPLTILGRALSWLMVVAMLVWMYWLFTKFQKASSSLTSSLHKEHMATDEDTTFDDVIGNESAKEELSDLVAYLKDPEKFADIKMPTGVLFYGPPGTGKTLMARALAGEAGVPFLYTAGSEFDEIFVGMGSGRVRNLFATARAKAPCIIFIDEIDAIAPRSTMSNNTATLHQILSELDGFSPADGVVIIAATNRKDRIDEALLRPGRFDRKIKVGLPPVQVREQMLEKFLGKYPVAETVNLKRIAQQTMGMCGADLSSLVNWAALMRLKDDKEVIDTQMLEEAYLNTSIGKKSNYKLSERQKVITAYHESGHAISAIYTEGGYPISRATIIPRGDALGFVSFVTEDEIFITKKELNARLRVALGGRVAEELIFGDENVTTGAGSDFQSAANIAYMMVLQFGMSDLGILSYSDYKPGSNKEVEAAVQNILTSAKEDVAQLLREKKEEHHRLAIALLKYEILNPEEIIEVVKGNRLEHRLDSSDTSFTADHTVTIKDTVEQMKALLPGLLTGANVEF
eukprot:TRINITY_DN7031_c0_g1_i1.p1 TRINITY_DN7031_c0_g1~~TRINITY_DN7031_c0_g1_i1.p1  ORF type:complete len:716 (-),score=183.81 TRINITY_DN7031_c0_g1_i1:140-2287(-)